MMKIIFLLAWHVLPCPTARSAYIVQLVYEGKKSLRVKSERVTEGS